MSKQPDLTAWDLLNLPLGWHLCPRCGGFGRTIRQTFTRIDATCMACKGDRIVAHETYVRLMNLSWMTPQAMQKEQRRLAG